MRNLIQDLRLALRSVMRRPGLVIVAVLSLSVGVGATASVFTVFDALFLRTISGVEDPGRVVQIGLTRRGSGFGDWDYPDFVDARERVEGLEAAAAFELGPMSLSDDDRGERVLAMHVTSGYFETMGVELRLRRPFGPEVDVGLGEHPVMVLSHRMWTRRFDGDPGVLGRTIRLNRETYTVIGVAPSDFNGHLFGVQPAVWVPLTQFQRARMSELHFNYRNTMWVGVVGRLQSGATVESVNGSLDAVFAGLATEHPETNTDRSARAVEAGMVPADARGPMTAVLAGLIGLMLLVLGATCANVGGMLLARAASREREIAVRLALGSSRPRLVSAVASESMVLFALGGIGGLVVTAVALRWFDPNRLLPVPFPVAFDLSLSWRIFGFATLLTMATSVVFGLLPALGVTRADIGASLKGHGGIGGLRSGRLRKAFVAGQVGVSILLLASAGLFLRSIQRGQDVDIGFDPNGVYTVTFDLALEGYGTVDAAEPFMDELLTRVRSLPAVSNATLATDLPLDGSSSSTSVLPEGRSQEPGAWIQSHFARVTPGFFETLGIDVFRGRAFESTDGRDTPRVAVVNEYFAEAAWPGENSLGRTVQFGIELETYTIVGVVADTKTDLITDSPAPQVYSLLTQDFSSDLQLAVKAARPSDALPTTLREVVRSVDPALAMTPVRPLESYAGMGMLPHRIAAAVGSSLGVLALLLAAIGVYGVVAFSVTRRTREIGVRIALGATRRQILGLVLKGGLALALPGAVVGAVLAAAAGRLLQALLLGVSPLDPVAFGTAALALMAVVAFASFFPARRASAVQPMEALRHE